MERFHDSFPDLLDAFNLDTLEKDPNTIYGLAADLTLNYFNPGWFAFARGNRGEPAISERFYLGTPIADAIAGTAKAYYLGAFRKVLGNGSVWHHDYECSSPHQYRAYRQSVYPLHNREGMVIVNSLMIEQQHDPASRVPHEPLESRYTQPDGVISQCSNCRRVQRVSQNDVWDWVPAWVERVPHNTSHTFCEICFEYYYNG